MRGRAAFRLDGRQGSFQQKTTNNEKVEELK